MKSLISITFAAVLIVALLALLTPPVCGSPDESMYCGNQNCYEVLQVDRSSADLQKDVKKSYRKLSLKYHPDKNKDPDAADQFVAISTAYGVLSNDDQREAYDYYLDHPQEAMYNRYRFYQTKYAPKTDVRVAIAVLLLFISMCQYVFQVQEHRRVVNQLRASNRVASSARLLAMRESSKEASQAKRNGDKLSPYIDRVLETMYENGSLVKPSVTSVLVFQLLYLPLRAPQFLKWIEQVRENKKREIKEREAEEMEEKLRAVHLAKMANDRKQRKQLAIKKQKDKQRLKQSKEDKQRASEKAEREKNEKELKLRRKCKREVMAAAKALSNVDDATELVHDIDIVFSWPDVEKDSWKQIADQVKASPSTNDWILNIKRIAKEYRLEIEKKKKSLSNQLEQQDKARVARLTKPWHDRELAMLSKGTAKFPGGTKNRWQMIAAYVNSAGVGNERDAQQCIQKFQQSRPSVPRPGTTQQHSQTGDEVDDWSTEQQSKLEDGLSKFPSSMNKKERWNSIANLVPGKSAKQCAIRFKEIRTQIIAKNSASG